MKANTQKRTTAIAIMFTLVLSVLSSMAGAQTSAGGGELVNINTATAEQLAMLPRVGPALSGRIVEFRKENGEFKKTEDLILVKGIGEKTFKNLEPFVTVKGKTTLSRKLRTSDVEAALAARSGSESQKSSESKE